MMDFSRYKAQMRLPEVGEDGQRRLAGARVLVVGCGALGSPVAMLLAGAGVGNLLIADFDTVDISNLHRQLFYSENDAGLFKVDVLSRRLRELNSTVSVASLQSMVTPRVLESMEFIPSVVVDAADNPATTYMLDAFCRERSLPLVTAGVSEWRAQIFSFIPGSVTFGDVFPPPENEDAVLPCSIAGVSGPAAMMAASLQASEIIKIILGLAGASSRLTSVNLLSGEFSTAVC